MNLIGHKVGLPVMLALGFASDGNNSNATRKAIV